MSDPKPTIPLPNPDALHDEDNKPTTAFYRYLSSVEREARKTSKSVNTINASIAANAANIATLQTNVNNLNTLSTHKLTAGTLKTFASNSTEKFYDYTGIPSWVTKITLVFANITLSSDVIYGFLLGGASGFDTNVSRPYVSLGIITNWVSTSAGSLLGPTPYQSSSALFNLMGRSNASGTVQFYKLSDNTWFGTSSCVSQPTNQTVIFMASGTKTLIEPLTQIRLTSINNVPNFIGGSTNIYYE